jgi:hypothetical protein
LRITATRSGDLRGDDSICSAHLFELAQARPCADPQAHAALRGLMARPSASQDFLQRSEA